VRRLLTRAPWIVLAAALLALPLLPITRWTGAPDTGPETWDTMLRLWGLGTVVIAGVAFIGSRVGVRMLQDVRLPELPSAQTALIGMSAALGVAAMVTARVAFGGNPQLIDEAAQLFQAKVFAAGHLAAPARRIPSSSSRSSRP